MKMSISSEGCGSIIVVSNRLPFVLKRNNKGNLERHASWISSIVTGRRIHNVYSWVGPCATNNLNLSAGRKQQLAFCVSRQKSFAIISQNTDDDYQYFKKSSLPTFHFQDSLPRLPIPQLKTTCERYLRAQRPLLSDNNYCRTKSYVDKFLSDCGRKCQIALIKENNANKHTSYISKFLFDMYLADRTPLAINYNPFVVLEDQNPPQSTSQAVKAASLVISSLRFYKSMQTHILEPEIYNLKHNINTVAFNMFVKPLPKSVRRYGAYLFKALPLDMSQFGYLYSASRIPKYQEKDEVKLGEGKSHILVMKGGHFFIVDVLNENGDILPSHVILCALEKIVYSKEIDSLLAVGLLTTEDRDVWATARSYLLSIGNREVLDLIDSALFNLVLESGSPGSDPAKMAKFFLHGDGTNRWFDKSISLIVAKDGTAGVNFERSWGDGIAVMRYAKDILTDSGENPHVRLDMARKSNPLVRKLRFKLDGKAMNMINEAQKTYNKTCKSVEVHVLDYWKYGRRLCNSACIDPDALIQLGFQLAYYEMTGTHNSITESLSTVMFKHGRTEAVRSFTTESQQFCKAMRRNSPQNMLLDSIHKCSLVHSNLVKEAIMGQGFDRHLFALRLQAESLGLKPEMFEDTAYTAMNYNLISTSPLALDCVQLGGFGPVVPDGYGIAYMLRNERLRCIVTHHKGLADGAGFISALEEVLNKLYIILQLRRN